METKFQRTLETKNKAKCDQKNEKNFNQVTISVNDSFSMYGSFDYLSVSISLFCKIDVHIFSYNQTNLLTSQLTPT